MVPLVVTEIGQNDCTGGFVTSLMKWLDGHERRLPGLVMERVRRLRAGDAAEQNPDSRGR